MVQRHQDWCAVVCSFPRLGTALQRTGVQAGLLAIGVAHRLNGEETECLLEGAVSGEQVQVMSGLMCTGLWDEVRGNTLGWVFPVYPSWVSQAGHCSGQHGGSLAAGAV